VMTLFETVMVLPRPSSSLFLLTYCNSFGAFVATVIIVRAPADLGVPVVVTPNSYKES
jgi:hypothetical protein